MKLATVSAALSLLVSATALAETTLPVAAPAAVTAPTPTSAAAPELETLTAGPVTGGMKVSGWFLSPTIGTTSFGDRVRYAPGLRAGLYINKRFALGVTAEGLVGTDTELNSHAERNLGSYGGLLLQYIWHSDQLIHASVESTIGDGRWCATGTGSNSCATKQFLVFEPTANLELNIAKHVRLTSGVGYRFAAAGSVEGPSSREMSGLLVRSGLVFGSF